MQPIRKLLVLHSGVVLLSIALAAVAFVAGFIFATTLLGDNIRAIHVALAVTAAYGIACILISVAYLYSYKGGLESTDAKFLIKGLWALLPFWALYLLWLYTFDPPALGQGAIRSYLLLIFAMLYVNFALVVPAHKKWSHQVR